MGEKDANGFTMDGNITGNMQGSFDGGELRKVETVSSIQLTNEQFERLYLGPQIAVKGNLRKVFGNPTPIGQAGFLIAYGTLMTTFMGWGRSGGEGAATVGATIFLGGMLALLSAIGNFILGNSFPLLFFGVYGGFFVAYGAQTIPSFNAYLFQGLPTPQQDEMSPEFMACNGFLAVWLGVFTFMLFVASLRTNVPFVIALLTLDITIWLYAASRFYGAHGNAAALNRLVVAGGAVGFVTTLAGTWLLFAEVLTTVDFPYNIPVFDLSGHIPGAIDMAKKKRQLDEEEALG